MIPRPNLVRRVKSALRRSPAVVLLGPRQCGKTTLARGIAAERRCEYFDLEDPRDLAQLESPMLALEPLRGLVVIDEVQRRPELFPVLRVLIDRPGARAKFLLLGSASPHVVRDVSESLAGRVALVDMSGFDVREIGAENYRRLWLRGGLPRSYLARSHAASRQWRDSFIRTFLERDIPQLGIAIPAATLRRFWMMVAHYHGQVWNAAEFARSLGQGEKPARRYLDLLSGAFVVRQLPPWFENISKRQVKSPKVYVRDSGLLHALLGLETQRDLLGHPKLGASWEGFALEQVLAVTGAEKAYCWATYSGAEIDLVVFRGARRVGFEFKCTDAPRMTRSIRAAMESLHLDRVYVVYPGEKSYAMAEKVEAVSLLDLQPRLL
jgi:predicted AAA+ superfamily ATPase